MSRQAAIFHNRQRRRRNRVLDVYSGLIASPTALGSVSAGGPNPAAFNTDAQTLIGARYGLSFSTSLRNANELTLTLEDTTVFGTPSLVADELFEIEWIGPDKRFQIESAVAGTASFYVLDDWKRFYKIMEAVFS